MHNGTLRQNEDNVEEEDGDEDGVYVVSGEYTSSTGTLQN